MTNKELADALLKLDATQLTGSVDHRALTWRVLDSDRRRLRIWIAATISVWLVAAMMIIGTFIAFGLLLPAVAKALHEAGPADGLEEMMKLTAMLSKVSFFVTLAVLALAASSLGTILLVLSTRRATLRQVNASLIEISEQLKRLLPAAPSPPTTTS